MPRLRRSPAAGAFLDGVNAASLALMAVVTWQLGGPRWWTAHAALALTCAAALLHDAAQIGHGLSPGARPPEGSPPRSTEEDPRIFFRGEGSPSSHDPIDRRRGDSPCCRRDWCPNPGPGSLRAMPRRRNVEKPSITTRMNGPYLVKGLRLVDADGKEFPVPGDTVALCRCGGSTNKPFCDGTHSKRLPGRREGGARGRSEEVTVPALGSRRHAVRDLADAIEFCFQQGWTRRLARRPAHRGARAGDAGGGRARPEHEIGYVAHRAVSVTAEKVAINAVMAGCKPEYMPVVVAAVEGIGDPHWGYHGPGTSTGGAGRAHDRQRPDRARARHQRRRQPLRAGLARERDDRPRGPAGHAQRLRLACPGRSTAARSAIPASSPTCIAENEAESPWTPLHVERGFRPEQSAVTVMAAAGPAPVLQPALEHGGGRAHHARRRHADLRRASWASRSTSSSSPASTCGRSPTTAGRRREIRRVPLRAHPELPRASQAHAADGRRGPAGRRDAAAPARRVARRTSSSSPPAAGRAPFSAYIPGWGSKRSSQAVPRRSSDDRAPRSHHRGRDAVDRVRAAAGRARGQARRPRSRTRSSTRTGCWRRSATSSRRSTASAERQDVPQAERRACPPTRRSSTEVQDDLRRHGRRRSATEGPARRAVCSTESCWRRPACPRRRS